jgi:hypothetical protein
MVMRFLFSILMKQNIIANSKKLLLAAINCADFSCNTKSDYPGYDGIETKITLIRETGTTEYKLYWYLVKSMKTNHIQKERLQNIKVQIQRIKNEDLLA